MCNNVSLLNFRRENGFDMVNNPGCYIEAISC